MVKLLILWLATLGVAHAALRGEKRQDTNAEIHSRELKGTFGFPSLTAAEEAVQKAEVALSAKKANGRSPLKNHKESKATFAPTASSSPSAPPSEDGSPAPSTEIAAKGGKHNKLDKSSKRPTSSSSPSAPPDVASSISPTIGKAAKGEKGNTVNTNTETPNTSSSPSAPTNIASSIAPPTEKPTKGAKSTKTPTSSSHPSAPSDSTSSKAPETAKTTKGEKDKKKREQSIPPSESPSPSAVPSEGNATSMSARIGKKEKEVSSNKVQFFHRGPNQALPVSEGDIDFDDVGTVYQYGGPLYDSEAVEIPSANFTGVCTKTQSNEAIAGRTIRHGGGFCRFTYILQKVPEVTVDVMGEVLDIAGGVLEITGATNLLAGVSGEALILPLYDVDNETDFFRDAIVYEVDLTLF